MTGSPTVLPADLPPAWGASVGPAGLRLAPCPAPGEALAEVARLRVGRTVVSLRLRRRDGRAVLQVGRRFGPDLGVVVAWGGPEEVMEVLLDDHPLGVLAARLTARHEHEVHFLFVPR